MVPFFHIVYLAIPKTIQSSHLLRSGSDSFRVTAFQVCQPHGDEGVWTEEGVVTVWDLISSELAFSTPGFDIAVPHFSSSLASRYL
jgi:hypothetical protein